MFFHDLAQEIIQILHLHIPLKLLKVSGGNAVRLFLVIIIPLHHQYIMVVILAVSHTAVLHAVLVEALIVRILQFRYRRVRPLVDLVKMFQKREFKFSFGRNASHELTHLF